MYMWRGGSRILSLEDVAELNDVALNRALPLPDSGNPGWAGEVEAFFSTMQLTTNVNHTMWPFEEDEEKKKKRRTRRKRIKEANVIPRWSAVYGGSEQRNRRRSEKGKFRPATCDILEQREKMPPSVPPRSTHGAREEALSRRMK